MLMDKVVEKFLDIFPIIYFGKIWNQMKLRTPIRPSGDSCRGSSIAWVAVSLENHIPPDLTGVIYATPNGRAIYWPLQVDGDTRDISETRYVQNSNILALSVEGWLAYDKLGPLGEQASRDDQILVLRALCSRKGTDMSSGQLSELE